MRLYAAALATLLLLAPALLLGADGPAPARANGPPDPRERPPPSARFDGTYLLNETRVRMPTLPSWPASEGCLLVESWGGTTILQGGVLVSWREAPVGGAATMRLTVLVPGRMPMEVEGGSPMELRLDGILLSGETPTKILVRAAEPEAPFVRQQAEVRLAWTMEGGPVAAKGEGCTAE